MKKKHGKKDSAVERSPALAPSASSSGKTHIPGTYSKYTRAKYAINQEDLLLDSSGLCAQGNRYFSQKNYKKSVNYYTRAIGLEPNNCEIFGLRAAAYFELKEFHCAILDYTNAMAYTQDELHTFLDRRGIVWFELGGYNEALADFVRAIELMPNFHQAINHRADTHLKLEYYQAAIDGYMHAHTIQPEEHNRYEELIWAIRKKESVLLAYKQNLKSYLEARGNFSGFDGFIKNTTNALLPLAFLNWEKALKSSQAEPLAFLDQASVDELRNKYSECLKIKKLFNELNINPAGFDDFIGQLKGKLDLAFKQTKSATSLSGSTPIDNSLSCAPLAELLLGDQTDQPDLTPSTRLSSSYEAVETGISFNENYKRGLELIRSSNYVMAIQVFTELVCLWTKAPEVYYYRGIAFSNTGDYSSAIRDFKKTLKLKSKFRNTSFLLAQAYAYTDEFEDAIKYFTKAIKQKPKFPEAFHQRCVMYQHINEFQKALEDALSARRLYEEMGQVIPASLEFEINSLQKQLDDLPPASATQSQSASSASPVGESTLVADTQPVSGRVGLEFEINTLQKQVDDLPPASATQNQSTTSASPVGESTLVADAQPVSGRVGLEVDKQRFFQGGLSAFKHHDYLLAIENYRVVELVYPEAAFNLGHCYKQLGFVQYAIKYYTQAIKQRSGNYPEAYYNIACIYQDQGDYVRAVENYKIAINQKPEFHQTYYNLCLAYIEMNEFSQALRYANEAQEAYARKGLKEPEDFGALIHDLQEKIKQTQQTQEIFIGQTASSSSKNASYYFSTSSTSSQSSSASIADPQLLTESDKLTHLGNQYARRGNYSEAIHYYKEASDSQHKPYPLAFYNLGVVYLKAGNYQLAIENFSEAIRLDPKLIQAYTNRGAAYYNSGNYADAIKDFNEVIKVNSEDARARYSKCLASKQLGDYDNALREALIAIKLCKKSGKKTILNELETIAFGLLLGQFQLETEARVQTASSSSDRASYYLSPSNTLPQSSSAGIADPQLQTESNKLNSPDNQYARRGKYSEAIGHYKVAIDSLQKLYPLAFYNLGVAYLNTGNYQLAIENFSEAIRQDPKLIQAYTNRGAAYYNSGNYTDAIKDFNEVTKANPEDPRAYYSKCLAFKQLGEYDSALREAYIAIKLYEKSGRETILLKLQQVVRGLQSMLFLLEKGGYSSDAGVAAWQRPMEAHLLIGSADATAATLAASISGAQKVAEFIIAGRCSKANTGGGMVL